jgi:HTH-type transcriptional regulator/antitoxin HipB
MTVKFDQFSHSIKLTRKAAGLSQAQLAELAGVGKTLIFDIEKGHDDVSFSKLSRVLEALNIHLEIKLPFTPPLDETRNETRDEKKRAGTGKRARRA